MKSFILSLRIFPVILGIMSFSGCVSDLTQRPAIYPARVLTQDEKPCFSVENVRETQRNPPDIAVITVYLHNENKAEVVWKHNFNQKKGWHKLPPDQCIPYGELSPASVLKYGKKYSVYMYSSIEGDHHPYSAYFCVTKKHKRKNGGHKSRME